MSSINLELTVTRHKKVGFMERSKKLLHLELNEKES